MASAAEFEAGKLTDVWAPAGRDSSGQVRYRRARFDVLVSSLGGSPETYVVPLGSDALYNNDVAVKSDHSAQVGMEFGYYTGDSLFVEQHAGDGSDNVLGLHTFGPV